MSYYLIDICTPFKLNYCIASTFNIYIQNGAYIAFFTEYGGGLYAILTYTIRQLLHQP